MGLILESALSPTASWTEICAASAALGPRLPRLSPAERMVAGLLRLGLTNREIAGRLGKAEATVKHQVASILRKSGVPSRARFIAMAR